MVETARSMACKENAIMQAHGPGISCPGDGHGTVLTGQISQNTRDAYIRNGELFEVEITADADKWVLAVIREGSSEFYTAAKKLFDVIMDAAGAVSGSEYDSEKVLDFLLDGVISCPETVLLGRYCWTCGQATWSDTDTCKRCGQSTTAVHDWKFPTSRNASEDASPGS